MQPRTNSKILFFTFCLFFFSVRFFAQQSPVDALRKLYDEYPQEKIYIWFNKTGYVAGETIFFKAYVFSGYEVSFISTSLYVELYDADKKLIGKRLLPLLAGVTDGSIELDSKLNEGVYFIRAYTTWMLNFSEQFQFLTPIPVYNPTSAKKLTINKSLWKSDAVPEGGSLISGIESRVAVRRYATALLDSKWSGYVYEESNPTHKIKEFTAMDENVALFTFTPEERKKYYVYVKDEYGNHRTSPLPAVKNSGVSFTIEELSDSVTYRLRFKDIPGNGNGYRVIGEIQNQLAYDAILKKTGEELRMKISTSVLENGILHLTVFDPAMRPVAERLLFVNHSNLTYDSVVISQQLLSAEPRAKNKLLLNVDSLNWISYAISVDDASSLLPQQQENILSALWLSSDLTDPIQNPAAYFDHPDKNKIEALDAILISEKWKRFNWNDILNNKYPTIRYLLHNYLSYTGKVTKGKKLKANEEVNLILYYPDSSAQLMLALSDSLGNIFIDNILFRDDAKIFYQLNTKKYAAKLIDVKFERNNRFVPYILPLPETSYKLTETTLAEKPPVWITRASSVLNMEKDIEGKYKTLQEVVIRSKLRSRTDELNEKLSSGLFQSMNETVIDFVNEEQHAQGYTNILEWLRGRVAGLDIRLEDGDFVPYIRGGRASVYIDEMPAYGGSGYISTADIAMIKIIKGPWAFAIGGGSGIIAIYTLRGNMRPAQKEPSLPNNKIMGYDPVKKFFSPYYDIKSVPQPDKDTRDQLLWQTFLSPAVAVDKSKVDFFNNDNTKRLRVIVQGFTNKGFPVFFHKVFELPLKAF